MTRWQEVRLALGTASALGLCRFAYGLVLPAMAGELRWTLAQAGAMTTANGLGYLAGALAAAGFARLLGVAATFRLGMVLCAVSLAVTGMSADYPALLAGRAMAGFAGALVFVAGAVIAPTAVYFAGAGLGIALSGAVIPPLLDPHPARWPLVWAGLAVAGGLAAVLSWSAARSVTVHGGVTAVPVRPLWPVGVAYVLFAVGYIAYITFLSAYLADRHASTTQTATAWTVLGLAVMAAPVLWRRPIGHWPGGRVLAVLLGALAGAAALALPGVGQPVVLVSAVAYGLTFMAVPAAVTAIVHAVTPAPRLPRTLATFTVVFAAGQMVGPWLAGLLADHNGADAILAWTATTCGAGAVVAAVFIRPATEKAASRHSVH